MWSVRKSESENHTQAGTACLTFALPSINRLVTSHSPSAAAMVRGGNTPM